MGIALLLYRNRAITGCVIPAMPPMESLLILWLTHLAAAIDLITGLLMAARGRGGDGSPGAALSRRVHHPCPPVRRRSGCGSASGSPLALEFALASDLIRTAVAPSWDDIGKLAAIMALRTALNYFLEREFEHAARPPLESMRAAA